MLGFSFFENDCRTCSYLLVTPQKKELLKMEVLFSCKIFFEGIYTLDIYIQN